MRAPKQLILRTVCKGWELSNTWVAVPDDIASKARSLCRDGMLVESDRAGYFRPTRMGIITAGEIDV